MLCYAPLAHGVALAGNAHSHKANCCFKPLISRATQYCSNKALQGLIRDQASLRSTSQPCLIVNILIMHLYSAFIYATTSA
jgi:hypothetical protein